MTFTMTFACSQASLFVQASVGLLHFPGFQTTRGLPFNPNQQLLALMMSTGGSYSDAQNDFHSVVSSTLQSTIMTSPFIFTICTQLATFSINVIHTHARQGVQTHKWLLHWTQNNHNASTVTRRTQKSLNHKYNSKICVCSEYDWWQKQSAVYSKYQ